MPRSNSGRFVLYVSYIVAAVHAADVATWLPESLVPITIFLYCCVRGYAVTRIHELTRARTSSPGDAQRAAGRLAVAGQIGAALGALGSFLLLSVWRALG